MRQPIQEIQLPEATFRFFLKDKDKAAPKIPLPLAIARRMRDGSKIKQQTCELEIHILSNFTQGQIPTELTFANFGSLSTCRFEVLIFNHFPPILDDNNDFLRILDGLPEICVTKLSVKSNIKPVNFPHLAGFIKKNYQHLEELDLHKALWLSPSHTRDLFLELPEFGLTVLNLDFCAIGNVSTEMSQQGTPAQDGVTIKEIFSKFPFLKILNLSQNNLSDAGFEALSEALKENTALEVLDISYNSHIQNQENALSIAGSLAENLSIKKLIIAIFNYSISEQSTFQAIMDAAYISNEVRKHFGKEPLVIENKSAHANIVRDLSEDRRRELDNEVKETIKEMEKKLAQDFGVAMDEDSPAEASAAGAPPSVNPALSESRGRAMRPASTDAEPPAKAARCEGRFS